MWATDSVAKDVLGIQVEPYYRVLCSLKGGSLDLHTYLS